MIVPKALENCLWIFLFGVLATASPPEEVGHVVRQDAGAVRAAQAALHWCGPACTDAEDQQVVTADGLVMVRWPVRPWETLRYRIVSRLLQRGGRLDWETLAEIWRTLDEEWPTRVFHQVPIDATVECPEGHFFLRLGMLANRSFGDPPAKSEMLHAASAFMEVPELLQKALCSGWPAFALLTLIAESAGGDGGGTGETSVAEAFELRKEVDRVPGLAAVMHLFRSCTELHCLESLRQELQKLQAVQSHSLLGWETCPEGSVAAWMDRIGPLPDIPVCVRSGKDVVSDTIKRQGKYAECHEIFGLLETFRAPGGLVIDVGANLGACTMVLARLGYQVLAFEPLSSSAELVKASLRLNDPLAAPDGEGWGKAGIIQAALGEHPRISVVVEGRENAGDSLVLDEDGLAACNDTTHKCQDFEPVHVASLDEILITHGTRQVCLLKIDAQGAEMGILRGISSILQKSFVLLIHFEWRPHQAVERGDDPMAPLRFLSSFGYRILAPTDWVFEPDRSKVRMPSPTEWTIVAAELWPLLLSQKGNLAATPAPR
eukprot:TRINITY_DN1408_c1_g1_i1.p1 TRINITY_DN1408_c1_g1~~TRINITY_DN1408_c1_g1_i1.p1  ORF type:complete len:546 (-),score=107.94 TRINITY_DN1408_c1_g1_i1:62-1699(-)